MSEQQSPTLSFLALVTKLIMVLPERSQEIVKKRFGLTNERGETLEKIGSTYGITRERVRQIVTDATKQISAVSSSQEFQTLEERIVFTINKNNGIIRESEIANLLNLKDKREENALKFFAECSKSIQMVEDRGLIARSWAISRDILPRVKQVAQEAEKILASENRVLSDSEVSEKIQNNLPSFSKEEIISFLKTLVKVKKNKFGKWGLANWTEINPKGTREKIYLVLKEEKRPLHFTEIAQLIDKYQLGKRKAHPQTVHNELIKDDRFVLIGRGIYAMREWGYSEGTIKDVLKEILEKSRKPLTKEEILEQVLKIRKVKKTTVMINLNDAHVFERNHNLYTLRK